MSAGLDIYVIIFIFSSNQWVRLFVTMRLSVFFLLLFISFYTPAQTSLDSLLGEWGDRKSLPEDTVSVKLLLELSAAYKYDNADSAIYYAGMAEHYATTLDFLRGKGDALTAKGVGYYIMGTYDLSLTAHAQALEIHKQTGDNNGMAVSINGIALVYLGQEDLLRAIPYFRQAIAINREYKNDGSLANNYFNMGIAYDHLEEFDSAHFYLELAENVAGKAGNYRTKLMVNNRMAETLFRQGLYSEALTRYQDVLNADYYQSNWETTFAYAGLSQSYIKLGQPAKGIETGIKALEYGEKVGATWDIERALGILADAYAANNDFKNAFLTHKRYKAYSDTLFNEDKETEINYLFLKQKEAENKELLAANELKEQQLRQNQLVNIIFAVAVVSLIVIGYIIVKNSRIKGRLNNSLHQKNQSIERQKELIEIQNRKLAGLNKTNALVLSIISHDLRSPIASIQSMMDLFKGGLISPGDQKEIFNELDIRISNIATMMNSLLNWAGGQFAGIKANFEPVIIANLVAELLPVFGNRFQEKAIAANHKKGLQVAVLADPSQLRIILQNLISNALKFTRNGGFVEIFYSDGDEFFSVHIKDTGVGMDEKKVEMVKNTTSERITDLGTEQELGTGLGLILVRQFVEYNKGKLEIYSQQGEGSEFIVSLRKL